MSDPVVVGRYDFRHQAEMARGILDDAGIPAFVHGAGVFGARPVLADGVRLVVAPEDAEIARQALEDAGLEGHADVPAWSARVSPGSPRTGPSAARDVLSMALLFGGAGAVVLEVFFDLGGRSLQLAALGAAALLVGGYLVLTAPRESATSRTD